MRFLAEPTIALYLMSNVKGLLPNKIKQRLECDHNKSLYLLQTSVVFGGVRQQKRFLHWKRGKVSVEWGNVGYTMWDVLCGICYVVVEYAKWDVLWLNLNWGTTLWACLHLNEESGLEKGDLKFWLQELLMTRMMMMMRMVPHQWPPSMEDPRLFPIEQAAAQQLRNIAKVLWLIWVL